MTGTHHLPILLWPLTLLHLKLCWMFTGIIVDLVFCNMWYYKLCFLLEPLIINKFKKNAQCVCTYLGGSSQVDVGKVRHISLAVVEVHVLT